MNLAAKEVKKLPLRDLVDLGAEANKVKRASEKLDKLIKGELKRRMKKKDTHSAQGNLYIGYLDSQQRRVLNQKLASEELGEALDAYYEEQRYDCINYHAKRGRGGRPLSKTLIKSLSQR